MLTTNVIELNEMNFQQEVLNARIVGRTTEGEVRQQLENVL